MKYYFATLLMFTLFVAAAPNRAWACGSPNDANNSKQEKSCCSKTEQAQTPDNKGNCCGQSSNSGNQCPCNHEKNGGCHCPGCGIVFHSVSGFVPDWIPLPPFSFLSASLQKLAFYFADHLPEAVYLPIWQPPKLGA